MRSRTYLLRSAHAQGRAAEGDTVEVQRGGGVLGSPHLQECETGVHADGYDRIRRLAEPHLNQRTTQVFLYIFSSVGNKNGTKAQTSVRTVPPRRTQESEMFVWSINSYLVQPACVCAKSMRVCSSKQVFIIYGYVLPVRRTTHPTLTAAAAPAVKEPSSQTGE